MTSSNIYDEIVEEYSQAKSNPYKHYVEEPTFWSCAGKDFSGRTVLDLACGSGHYSRQFRSRGAQQVLHTKQQVFEGKRHDVHPQNGIPGFSFHFPKELSYMATLLLK